METLQRTANRGSLSTGYEIDNSIVFETANSERLYRNNGSTGQRRTFTISAWVKRTALGYHRTFGVGVSGNNQMIIIFNSSDQISWYDYHGGSYSFNYLTNRVFRDTSAYYHLVFAVDTEQGTEANRVRLYVNGVEETSFATQTEPALNRETNWNYANGSKDVGNILNEAPFASCYMSEVYHINDQQLAPTEFGEFDDDTGIWKPKAFTGTFGSEDSYLNFDSSGSMGADSSGNSNDFTLQNITSADQATDTPTNNFCTLNPLWTWTYTMGVSDGATKVNNTVTAWGGAKGSIGVNSGKWYWEHGSFSGNDTMFGIQNQAGGGNTQAYLDPYTLAIQANANVIQFTDPSNRTEAFSKTFAITDIWGVALDLDNNTIAFYRNGSIVNSAFSIDGLIGNGEFFPFVAHYGSGLNSRVNFGGYTGITISSAASDSNNFGTFEYAPPTGYYALCTKNLAEYG